MAIRTVSNAGGEWSSAATWVGGVKPIAGKDSVAFTATSGPLTINGNITLDGTIKGIDFTNYTNTFTMRGQSILIDDTNAAGRASFVNLGTGGYTVVVQDLVSGTVVPAASNTEIGIYLVMTGTQTCTLTSNGTAWSQYLYMSTDQPVSLVGNWTQNGRWASQIGSVNNGTTLQNNRFIINGDPVYDISTPGFEMVDSHYFYRCTSTVEINSPHFYSSGLFFDGNRLELNSAIVDMSFTLGVILFTNTLGTAVTAVITTPNLLCGVQNNTTNLTLTANTLTGELNNDNGAGTYTFTNINGYVHAVISDSTKTFTLNVSGTINGDVDCSNDVLSITANTINASSTGIYANSGTVTFNVSNITSPLLSIVGSTTVTIGAITTLNLTDQLTLASSQAGSSITYSFPALTLSTSVAISVPTSNITFAELTVPTVTVNSTTAATLTLGSTAGSIGTLTITSPTTILNKNNCAITTASITSTVSTTINGTTNNTLGTLNSNTPLLLLDAANVVNSSSIINLVTSATRTIHLLSAMNVGSIIGLAANTTILTLTGSFGATINTLSRFASVRFTLGNSYLVTNRLEVFSCTLQSNSAGTKATFNLGSACTNLLVNVSLTDIDASLTPRGIHTHYGTATNCTNVRVFTDNTIPQVTHTF